MNAIRYSTWGCILVTSVVLHLSGCSTSQSNKSAASDLQKALTFHAPFDGSADAAFARGDRTLYSAPSMKQAPVGTPGLPASGVVSLARGQGRFGDALHFHKKSPEMVFYRGEKNIDYQTQDWSGTVSFWLRVDPDKELEPGFCDMIQITPRAWNDAAFFVEFEKRTNSAPFRFGAYADFKVWNPENREWGKIPFNEKPLVTVDHPPFSGDRWTHVVFTFSNFNTKRNDGMAKLYLNGQFQGAVTGKEQTFTWDPGKCLIMLGLSYVGFFDDLAIFNRALTEPEIQTLHQLKEGTRSLGEPILN